MPPSSDPSEKRVLILTAGFGDGHNAAAKGIRLALGEHADTNVLEVDIFDLAYPAISGILKKSYRFGITHMPKLWEKAYHLSDNISYKNDSLGVFRKAMLGLKRLLEEWQPDAVVHTYPFYSQLLEAIVGRFQILPFTVTTVITDAVSINQTWLKGRTDTFIVIDEASRDVLISWGIPEEKVKAMGFPVSPEYERLSEHGVSDEKFECPPRLLYLPSTPKGHISATMREILSVTRDLDLKLTIVLGRHTRRLARMMKGWQKKFPTGSMEIIGWTDSIPRLLREHHVIIGKAGGASVQESTAAHRPLLVNYVVPGQEEGNAVRIVEAGCGMYIKNPEGIAPALRDIFANEGKKWREMCNAARVIAVPDAAYQVADFVLQQIENLPNHSTINTHD